MDIRRVKYKQKDAILVKGVSDPELVNEMKSIAPVLSAEEGYIVLTGGGGGAFQKLMSLLVQRGLDMRENQRNAIKEKRNAKWQAFLDSKEDDFAYADEIKDGILKRKKFECTQSAMFLMNHQRAGVLLADRFNYYAFFYDTGTGKTVLALQIIEKKIKQTGAVFLVLCPKSIIQTAWMDDCTQFYSALKLLPLTGDYKPDDYQKIHFRWAKASNTNIMIPGYQFFKKGSIKERTDFARKYLAAEADCFIVNPELFIRSPDKYLRVQTADGFKQVNGIIVDESSRLKNPSNQLTKVLKDLRPQLDYLYLLSGKPAPNDISEFIPQVEILEPRLLRPGIKSEVYNGHSSARKELTSYINMVSVTVSKKDCFDLPETTEMIREVSLSKKVSDQYRSMKYHMQMEINAIPEQDRLQKSVVYVNHVLACLQKLRQLTGGFVYDGNDSKFIHNDKVDEVISLLNELGDEQVLIWCQFQYEIEHLKSVLLSKNYTVGTAYGKTNNLNENIYAFKENRFRILIAHPRTLQFGVTLTNCCYAIYFSTSYSYEEYYQSHDRIYRKGQSRPCTYIFLQCKDTIDEVMFRAIKSKQSRTEIVEQTIKHIYQTDEG